jgi:hypothetical protein
MVLMHIYLLISKDMAHHFYSIIVGNYIVNIFLENVDLPLIGHRQIVLDLLFQIPVL